MAKTVTLKGRMAWDNSSLKKAMKETRASAGKLKGALSSGAGAIVGFTAATAGLTAGLTASVQKMTEVQKLSEKFGSSTGFLLNASKAAAKLGVQFESLADAQKDLVRNTKDALGGGGASKFFADLNINLEKFRRLNPDERFAAVAKALGGMSDRQEAAAIAMGLMGENAAELLEVFRNPEWEKALGRQGLIGDETVRSAKALGDSFNSLKESAKELGAAAAIPFSFIVNSIERIFTGSSAAQRSLEAMRLEIDKLNSAPGRNQFFQSDQGQKPSREEMLKRLRTDTSNPFAEEGFTTNPNTPEPFGPPPFLIPGRVGNPNNVTRRDVAEFSFGFSQMPVVKDQRAARMRRARNKGNLVSGSRRLLAGRQDLGVQGATGPLSGPMAFRTKREEAARKRDEARRAAQENKDPSDILTNIEKNTRVMSRAMETDSGG